MIQREEIIRALRQVLNPKTQLVVVHTNIGTFGPIENPLQTILLAFQEALSPDVTLAFPAFTFSFFQTRNFHWQETPTEMGMFNEFFRKEPNVIRTPHPVYSFAVRGPLNEKLSSGKGSTCWGSDTFFEVMEEVNTDVVMFGCSWDCCTLFHRAEELGKVPYRCWKQFTGKADFGNGWQDVSVDFWGRRLELPVENDFNPYAKELRERGKIRSSLLGRGKIEAASAKDIVNAGMDMIQQDSLIFLKNRENFLKENQAWRIALLGSTNLSVFEKHFKSEAEEWLKESCRLFVPPFNQYRQQLVDPRSDLRRLDPQWIIFMDRSVDILGSSLFDLKTDSGSIEALSKAVSEKMNTYLDSIHLAREHTRAKILVLNLDAPAYSPLSLADCRSDFGHQSIVAMANALLSKELSKMDEVYLVDMQRIHSAFGRSSSIENKFWYMGRIPFSRDFSIYLSRYLAGAIMSLAGKTTRLIVLDLDNTLWGGIVGESGFEEIQIGGDFPGNVFQDFQKTLLNLSQRGLALAICSKNSEELIFKVLREHSAMVLREKDFVAHRINWKDKVTNILELAEELSLGMKNICFLDDSPQERALVQQQLPDVTVPDLPQDLSDWTPFLMELPCLQVLSLTKEDSKRVQQYKVRSQVEYRRKRFGTLEDFYRDLQMTLYFEEYGKENQARLLQLLAKTNQFNTTTRRYGHMDLMTLKSSGVSIWGVGLKDRFGEKETIGVVIVRWHDGRETKVVIDSFLLSCRVLGRSVETGVLGWVAEQARKRAIQKIEGEIIVTERNQPVRDLFLRHGFQSMDHGRFMMDISETSLSVPDWFKVYCE